MNTTTPKQLVESVFAALAQGNTQPFADAMADDFSWIISGHGPWSRTWRGKHQVRQGLMAPLFAQFAGTYRNRATRIVAEGDMVVVHRHRVAESIGAWQASLALIDAKLDFYAEWIATGRRPLADVLGWPVAR